MTSSGLLFLAVLGWELVMSGLGWVTICMHRVDGPRMSDNYVVERGVSAPESR